MPRRRLCKICNKPLRSRQRYACAECRLAVSFIQEAHEDDGPSLLPDAERERRVVAFRERALAGVDLFAGGVV